MHYIGVLFSGDENLLEQYYEGLEVEPYIAYSKEEIIGDYINNRKNELKWRREKIKNNSERSSEYQDWIEKHPRFTRRTAWAEIKKDYEGRIDDDGNIICKFNPDAQWDWYEVGGRWSGYFPLKAKDSNGEQLHADETTIGEVDWETYLQTKLSPYCYITESGEWVAKGEIGWFTAFGIISEEAWKEQFMEEVRKYSEDTRISAIDFHI